MISVLSKSLKNTLGPLNSKVLYLPVTSFRDKLHYNLTNNVSFSKNISYKDKLENKLFKSIDISNISKIISYKDKLYNKQLN